MHADFVSGAYNLFSTSSLTGCGEAPVVTLSSADTGKTALRTVFAAIFSNHGVRTAFGTLLALQHGKR